MTQNEGRSAPDEIGYEVRNDIREHDGPAISGDVHHTAFCGDDTQEVCPQCGHALNSTGLEEFLGRMGITEDMVSNLKGQFQNVDIDDYLNTAREYLKQSGDDVQLYVKENPVKVAVGVAALAFCTSLVWSFAHHQARTEALEDRSRQLALKHALAGPRYRLDEVLSELGVAV